MSADYIFILLAGAAAGGFINGLAAFGTALFSLGFWLQIMTPVEAVAIVLVMSVVSGLQGVSLVRHNITENPKRLARFLLPALFGIPLGVAALSILNPAILKQGVAGFLILYGGFFTFRKNLPKFERPTPLIDSIIGFLGGVLGGAASLSGALPTMWCSMRPWPKSETRAVLQPFNVTVLGLTAVIFAFKDVYTQPLLIKLAIVLPISMVFAQIGIAVFKRLTDAQFRRLLILMMFTSGIIMMLKELL